MSSSHWLLLASLGLLLGTKLADLWTTIRHIGRYGESNPLARRLFERLGFVGGLAVVMGLWAVIVGIVYASAWSAPGSWQVATAVIGCVVAWVQGDVARFNATRRASRVTRIAGRVYGRWAEIAAAWRQGGR